MSLLYNRTYTSGLLTSQPTSSQTYGYYEVRAQLPQGEGAWPAFWLLPTSGTNPPEVDILEAHGSAPSLNVATVHDVALPGGATGTAVFLPNLTGFHTYGFLWGPATLTWFVDGAPVAQVATPADMNTPMYMLLNLAVDGYGAISPTSLPTPLSVDYVHAYATPDTLTTAPNLTVSGTSAGDTLLGSVGDDTISGGLGDDVLDGRGGSDTAVYAGARSEYVVSADTMNGGYWVNDTGSAGEGRDHLINIESVRFSDGTYTPGSLVGGVSLTGGPGADSLVGGPGNDTLDGGAGDDTLAGGAGDDIYYVDSSGDVVTEATGGGFDIVYTSANWTATPGAEIEKLVATGSAQLQLAGDLHAMEIDGNSAVNRLDDGGAADILAGGGGNDTYVVSNAGTTVVEGSDSGSGYDTVRTTLASYSLTDNVEVLTFTGSGAFHGQGNALANVITGGAGADTLDGGAGADRLVGGMGNDTYYTDTATDVVVENAGEGQDTVMTTASSFVAPVNVEKLMFIGSGAFTGYASTTSVSIQGGTGNDSLYGGKAADTLDGGGGNDVLNGGTGTVADTFRLNGPGLGVDRIITYHGAGEDHVALPGPAFGISSLSGVAFVNGTSAPGGAPALVYDSTGKLFWDAVGGDPAHQVLVATFDGHPALAASDFILG